MKLIQKVLLIQQSLTIKHYKEISPEDLSGIHFNSGYKVDISGNKIRIQKEKRWYSTGWEYFIIARGKIKGDKIDLILTYDKLRQSQFMMFVLAFLIAGFTLHWVFLILAVLTSAAGQARLIIVRQEIIKIFEKIWV